ncbi:metallophosphoesterase [Ideonella margarita]|uniref:Metallophosphoesterase n=1 Tax=Ideonella margarita TaxID=2984191 RepID=A0ABU9C8Z0_9BURK
MRLQLLSDLHLETETFEAQPAPGAELLVLAGDIDATWAGLELFANWPVPVIFVPGNHEFDGRDMAEALAGLRARCTELGMTLLSRETLILPDDRGRRIRFVGTVRWSDFDLFGAAQRERAMRAGHYFTRVQRSTHEGGQPFDADAVRATGLADRLWLEQALAVPPQGQWDATVVITHFAPSLRSGDPRYGKQPGTASFCNADDDLIPRADLWLHGHLHCRHDYTVDRPGRAPSRVVCQARGLVKKGEAETHDPLKLIEV